MKSNFIKFLLIILITFSYSSSLAQEQFNFDVTEIEIYEKGNKFRGLKRGKISTANGITLDADKFEYNKISNILDASGNVIINDIVNKITIVSNEISYLKNDEIIFTNSKSTAFYNNIVIDANGFKYNKKLNILNAKGNVKIEDQNKKIIILSEDITHYIEEQKFLSKSKSEAFDQNLNIKADEFEYDKNLNIINAYKNVIIEDKIEDVLIFSENTTYLKNKEKIFTQGDTEAIIESKYNFKSKDTVLLRDKKILKSSYKTVVNDDDNTVYNLNNFIFHLETKLLKGNNINIITNYNKPKSDQFYFSSGIFNLKNKKFSGKDTKIVLHKNIFQKEKEKFLELIEKTEINKLVDEKVTFENEPRLYGVSSNGDEDKTIVKKGIFTSCKKNDKCPAWSMKSKKIIHDKKKRQIMYENSILNLYNVPVFYFPKFFHPDPTVKRQSGFLRPQLNRSKILGTAFYLPYYHVISDNKDFTFKPQIFDSEIEMFQNEYRQVNKDSKFVTDFGITRGYQSSITGSRRNSIGHLFASYEKNFKLENFEKSEMKINIESVTNDTFLNVFQNNLIESSVKPGSTGSLKNSIDFILDKKNSDFSSGIRMYETLSGSESDRYEYNFPYYNFSKNFFSNLFEGSFNFSSTGANVLNNTNILKSTINNNLSYSSLDYFTNLGLQNNYNFYFKNLNTVAKNHSIYKSSPQSHFMSLFETITSFPLEKKSENFEENIVPKMSFRINPAHMKNLSNRGVNVDNIFSVDRLGITEAYEEGKSLTIGLDYRKQDITNSVKKDLNNDGKITEIEKIEKYFEIKLGGVLRDVEEDKISSSTTLNRKASNLFGSITNHMYDKVKLDYNFAIDNDLTTFESNDVTVKFNLNNLITTFNFSETNGEMGNSNIMSNSTLFKLDENNYFTFETRRNRKISLTEYYDFVYEYKIDCLTAGVKYRKTYYSDRDAKPTEDLMLTLTMFPLTTLEQNVNQRFYRENDLFD